MTVLTTVFLIISICMMGVTATNLFFSFRKLRMSRKKLEYDSKGNPILEAEKLKEAIRDDNSLKNIFPLAMKFNYLQAEYVVIEHNFCKIILQYRMEYFLDIKVIQRHELPFWQAYFKGDVNDK